MAVLTGDQMRARLQKALDLGSNVYEIEDIVDAIEAGRMQAFKSDNAFLVTQIGVYPRKKVLSIILAAGELEEVMVLVDQARVFAGEHGCAMLSCVGRPGWQRVLPKHGWEQSALMFVMGVEG